MPRPAASGSTSTLDLRSRVDLDATSTLEPPTSPAAPIDPRIRARRIEVRRHEGRRRLARLVDLGVVVAVALGFVAALYTPLLDVDQVQVAGAARSGTQTVLDAAGIAPGDQLVQLDLQGAGERVAALPWVHDVGLRRGLDGTVTLDVRERTAVAAIASGAQPLLVDVEGRVLGPAAEAPEVGPVVLLTGFGPPPLPGAYLDDGAGDALALAERVAVAAPGSLATLQAQDLTATLAQGGDVRFGDATQLDAKVRSLRTALAQVDLSCLDVLDLRLPGSPVLTREDGCS